MQNVDSASIFSGRISGLFWTSLFRMQVRTIGDEKTVEKEDINSTHLLEFVYNIADLPRYIASFPCNFISRDLLSN